MSKYDALLEDEDNIFGGSPKSKFWDIINIANDEIVKDQMDQLLEKFAVMETMLLKEHGEEKLNQIIQQYTFEHSKEIDNNKKSTYVEFTGEVVSRLDS